MIDFTKEKNIKSFAPGKVIFSEGDDAGCMYAVISGEVELTVNGVYIATLLENEFFGEMGVLDSEQRSADAITKTRVTLAEISKERFLEMVDENSDFALQIIRVLVGRLRVETKMKSF